MTHTKIQSPAIRGRVIKIVVRLMGLFVLTVMFACAGLFLVIRFGVDGNQAAQFIVPRLEESCGTRISFSSADISWTSTLKGRLAIRGIKVMDKAGISLLIDMPEVILDMSLGHLIWGTFLVEKAEFLRPRFSLYRHGPSRATELTQQARISNLLISPRVVNLEIIDGSLIIAESSSNSKDEKPLASRINLFAENISPLGIDGFSLKGFFPHGGRDGSLDLSGRFSRSIGTGGEKVYECQTRVVGLPLANLQALASFYNLYCPFSDGYLDSDAEFSGVGSEWKASGHLELCKAKAVQGDIFVRDVLLDKAGASFAAKGSSNKVDIDLTQVSVPGINLALAIRAVNIADPDPSLALTVHKADVDLEKMSPLIPLRLISPQDRVRLMNFGLKGHAVFTRGSWSGKFSEITSGMSPYKNLELVAILDKVSGFLPGIGFPVTNATGEIRLNSFEAVFKGISLTIGNSPIVLNGWITNLNTTPRADLFLSLKADAQDLQPFFENSIVAAHVGPLAGWFNDPGGSLAVTLDLKGELRRPDLKGRITLEDFQCNPNRLPLPLRKINGSIRFRGDRATFSDIKGLLGSSPFQVNGSMMRENIEVTADFKLNPLDLKRLNFLPVNLAVSGQVPVSINVKGKASELTFGLALDLRSNSVGLGTIIDKRAGIPLRLEFSGVRDASGINLDDASLILDRARISGRASMRDDGKVTVTVNLPPRGIPTGLLTQYCHPDLELQPGGRLEGDTIIIVGNSTPSYIEANLLFSHLSLRVPGMHKRSEGMTGSLKHRGKSLQLNLERVRVGNSHITGTMSLTDFENPKFEILLESSFLDTTDFTAQPGQMIRMTWGDYIRSNRVIKFLSRSGGSCFARVAKGKTRLRTFSDFRANFEANNGQIRVPSWQANFADGLLRGTANFDICSNTSKPLMVDFQGDRLKMERLIISDPAWLRVSGDILTEGHLEWHLGPSQDGTGLYKTGIIEVRMNEGVINRFDILSKLFSLVNFGSILRGRLPDLIGHGLPFHKLTWTTEVFDNKWKVKDLKLLSDAARIDSSGMYFSGQERVDFKMDVSPLVGFDAIFSGLFGNLITKDGKTLTTTFRIRGLYSSPDIRLEPFENLKLEE